MSDFLIIILVIIIIFLIWRFFRTSECDHAQQIYYDASGDKLPGDQSETCFSECKNCGKTFLIPSGFQSDAHFENYLNKKEQSGSQNSKNDN